MIILFAEIPLEAHRRAVSMAKQVRLIDDFAIILRHSIAQKTYMDLQMVSIAGKDPEEQERQLLNYLYAESEGLSLAMAKARLEGVDKEILKIGNEQFKATGEFVTLQKLLFNRIDKQDGSDLTFLSNSVKEARALALQKCEELETVLKKRLEELENPKVL